MESQVLVL